MSGIKKQRLFVGIGIPERTKEAMLELWGGLEICEVQRVPCENLHLTLKFIGEVGEELQKEIVEVLDRVNEHQGRRFMLEPGGVGVFPSSGQPGVMWAGFGKIHPLLFQLQKSIDDALRPLGIEPERRVYQPHVTIAGCRKSSEASIRNWLKLHRDWMSSPFFVNEFILYSSLLRQGNPVYTPLKGWVFSE